MLTVLGLGAAVVFGMVCNHQIVDEESKLYNEAQTQFNLSHYEECIALCNNVFT